MEEYDQCQRIKNRAEMLVGKLRPNKILERLQQHTSVDFITKLPVSKGYDLILVVYDRFSKMLYFVVMTEKITAERLARLFKNNIQKLHRLPESVILDRGPQFVARLMRELNKMLGIETKLSMTYYSQTNRQIERTNQELEQYLRMYVNHKQNNQLEWLATAEFAFNNKIYTVMKLLLFKVNYGRELRISFDIRKKRKHVKTEEFMKEIKNRYEETKVVLVKFQEEIKRQADRNRKKVEKYKVRDQVLISTKDFPMKQMKRLTRKLTEKYIGPYYYNSKILELIYKRNLVLG